MYILKEPERYETQSMCGDCGALLGGIDEDDIEYGFTGRMNTRSDVEHKPYTYITCCHCGYTQDIHVPAYVERRAMKNSSLKRQKLPLEERLRMEHHMLSSLDGGLPDDEIVLCDLVFDAWWWIKSATKKYNIPKDWYPEIED
jgi:predicted nucleic-acid-binding Zn-ribbon protein